MISKDASVVGQTLVNFISAQLKETWHLVESVDKTTESGSRWAEAVKGIFLLLTERIPSYPFVVARGQRQICRVSGHPNRFVVTTAEGEIDFELTKRVGFMVDKAVLTGTVDRGSRLEQLASRPARSGLTTAEGQWYAIGDQFVFRRYEWRQMRTEDLISLYDRVGEIYQQVEMSGEQKTQIVQMIEELKKQERALGA